jgi:hypothetical protein
LAVPAAAARSCAGAYRLAGNLSSALIFAAGHLPAALFLLGGIDVGVAAFVIGLNSALGLLFGYLFWRHGLESAMIALALAHAVSVVANLL